MWKKGPLPAGTYNWGGCVPIDQQGSGFFFADFCGDHVQIFDGTGDPNQGRRVEANDVAWYNNSLDLPPTGCKGRKE